MLGRRQLLGAGLGSGLGLALGLVPGQARAAPYVGGTVTQPGTIIGRISYGAKVPRPPLVKYSGDCAYCRKFKLRQEELLVDALGSLRNVVVALEGISRGKPLPTAVPTLAEARCTFVPHVMSVCAGSKVELYNQDPVLNTFHAVAMPSGRTLFNIGMPRKGQRLKRRIRRPGLVKVLCDVHPWEVAYIAAFDHPYHTVTGANGTFRIEGIPPGKHTLSMWHEKLGLIRREAVTVKAGATAKIVLRLNASGP